MVKEDDANKLLHGAFFNCRCAFTHRMFCCLCLMPTRAHELGGYLYLTDVLAWEML